MGRSIRRGHLVVNPREEPVERHLQTVGQQQERGQRGQRMAALDRGDVRLGERPAQARLGQAGCQASASQLGTEGGGELRVPPSALMF
jgi:hypothetical protein